MRGLGRGALATGLVGTVSARGDAANLGLSRHEDHVGHKVEWENDLHIRVIGKAGAALEFSCDVLVKLHQGTHTKDAFTNNLHELIYHIRCSDKTELHVTMMSALDNPASLSAPVVAPFRRGLRRRLTRRLGVASAESLTRIACWRGCWSVPARPRTSTICTKAGRRQTKCAPPTASGSPSSTPTFRCSGVRGRTDARPEPTRGHMHQSCAATIII